MAACLLKIDTRTKYCVFSIDSEDDTSLLPTTKNKGTAENETLYQCCQGSVAMLVSGGKYVLNSDNSWVKSSSSSSDSSSSGSSSGGTISDEDVATDEEVEEMLTEVFGF